MCYERTSRALQEEKKLKVEDEQRKEAKDRRARLIETLLGNRHGKEQKPAVPVKEIASAK
jgi:hypothetical protein